MTDNDKNRITIRNKTDKPLGVGLEPYGNEAFVFAGGGIDIRTDVFFERYSQGKEFDMNRDTLVIDLIDDGSNGFYIKLHMVAEADFEKNN